MRAQLADAFPQVFKVVFGKADVVQHQCTDAFPFVILILIAQHSIGLADMLGHLQRGKQVLEYCVTA